MPTRLIFLTGSPISQNLCWKEDGLLCGPIAPFTSDIVEDVEACRSAEGHTVRWRQLRQWNADDLGLETTVFLAPQHFAASDEERQSVTGTGNLVISQFYDHSFTVHETSEISVSQDSIQESDLQTESSGRSLISALPPSLDAAASVPLHGQLSDLEDVPNANYLLSIAPQTMSVNLVVGVITVRPPRRVVTRQWKRELEIVELVVADETRTGFGVTVWLPALEASHSSHDHELRRTLSALRPRDIVLLRTVGLSVFQDRVYGQSLRRGLTKIHLLYRRPVDLTDAGGVYDLQAINSNNATGPSDDLLLVRVRRVRAWMLRFVDSGPDREGGEAGLLPPDTQ
ncbi:hypothetical protein ASPZODRAFT_59866 [Penicilliopsis zonata CBS 506.65]|uniref:OB domain-containing protein n=1 Tax=Penicilliopsis zonata CBS 506.65 TaxID=1073090 RepID=A0A1L9SQC1_9EURO|nr:hypothetical protein ASPZODRAFT_59866 [Penicilliopsis zonata CBS 506.65]OJJ49432.1 hypothetical protein ASPZODRAFT_59866 [Penicilliopsis zonata CBS 506.65]